MLRAVGAPYGEVFDRFGIWLPRVHLDCDFKYPARLDDRLRVSVYVSKFGNTSITLNFDVLHIQANRLTAVGHEVLVATDRTSLAPQPFPTDLRKMLEPFLLSEDQARSVLLAGADASA